MNRKEKYKLFFNLMQMKLELCSCHTGFLLKDVLLFKRVTVHADAVSLEHSWVPCSVSLTVALSVNNHLPSLRSYHHWPDSTGCTSIASGPGRRQRGWCRFCRSDTSRWCWMWPPEAAAGKNRTLSKYPARQQRNLSTLDRFDVSVYLFLRVTLEQTQLHCDIFCPKVCLVRPFPGRG